MRYYNFDILMDIPVSCILDFSLTEEINQHGKIRLRGICGESDNHAQMMRENGGINIEVKEEGKSIFSGSAEHIELKYGGGVLEFELFACSYSFLLDIEKKKRTFQCLEDTYQMVAEKVMSSYPKSSVHNTSSKTRIPHMFLQYEETDWEFLQRLAFSQGGYLCVNSGIPYPALRVVERRESPIRVMQSENYEIQKKNASPTAESGEVITYIVELAEMLSPGMTVSFLEKELIVCKIETSVRKGELCCRLYLTSFENIKSIKQENKSFCGLKLEGIVKEIRRNQLTIHFLNDQENSEHEDALFSYAGGVNNETGYYMPQPGDKALVSFFGTEETAIVTELVRSRENPGILADNPSIKYFTNEHQKEMYLHPTKLVLCEGHSKTQICLMKDGQALISAPDSVKIESGGKLVIGGNTVKNKLSTENISIRGGSSVNFQTGTSSICMNQNGTISCKAENGVTCTGRPGQINAESEYEFSPEGTAAAQGAMLAVASSEFISQAITGENSYEESAALLGDMFGISIAPPVEKGQESQSYHPIRDGLLGGENELFQAISYGESLNGEE